MWGSLDILIGIPSALIVVLTIKNLPRMRDEFKMAKGGHYYGTIAVHNAFSLLGSVHYIILGAVMGAIITLSVV